MNATGEGIPCPVCGRSDLHQVKDTRPGPGYWRRRRYCACGERFNTVEFHVANPRAGLPHFPALSLQQKLDAMSERQRKIVEHIIWEFGPHKENGEKPS